MNQVNKDKYKNKVKYETLYTIDTRHYTISQGGVLNRNHLGFTHFYLKMILIFVFIVLTEHLFSLLVSHTQQNMKKQTKKNKKLVI